MLIFELKMAGGALALQTLTRLGRTSELWQPGAARPELRAAETWSLPTNEQPEVEKGVRLPRLEGGTGSERRWLLF